jgi:gluconate transporter
MIWITVAGILLLLLLIGVCKIHAFIALTVISLFVGIANGMPLAAVLSSLTKGIGATLGPLLLVLGLGVMLGCLLTESGAAAQISKGLIRLFGVKYIKLAMVVTGFSVGIALFYNAGFIVLIPLAYAVAANTGLPLIYITTAMASALSVTHGFLPPHPGPTAIVGLLKADIGKTLLYGLLVSIPALIAAGLILPEFLRKITTLPPKAFVVAVEKTGQKTPSFAISLLLALIPVLLMAFSTLCVLLLPGTGPYTQLVKFIGDPGIAMLVAVLTATAVLSIGYGNKVKVLMDHAAVSLTAIAGILLIIAAGGAFKQVLTDSGVGTEITTYFSHSSLSPLFLGWLVALLIRVAIGSATVAGLMTAGIVQPFMAVTQVSPELMVLSIGAGSLMCSHVNDTGFWMFKEYIGLTLADTFRSWTVMESVIGITGLAGVLLLSCFIHA